MSSQEAPEIKLKDLSWFEKLLAFWSSGMFLILLLALMTYLAFWVFSNHLMAISLFYGFVILPIFVSWLLYKMGLLD